MTIQNNQQDKSQPITTAIRNAGFSARMKVNEYQQT